MYQKVTILGRLGRDVEVRYTQGGDAVASFSVATSERWNDRKSGEQKEKTEWFNCTAFKRTAEICGEYLRKGSLVMIEGKMQTDKYEKEGQTHYSTKLIVREMKMLDGKPEGQQGGNQNNQGYQNSAPRGNAPPSNQAPQSYGGPDDQDFDDDIPF